MFDRAASHRPSRLTLVLAALGAFVVLGGLTALAIIAPRGVPGVRYYDLDAHFADSIDIRLLSPVYISGHRVGQVSRIAHRGNDVVLHLQIQPGEGPLRTDTTARVRVKNLVGAKYVEITPGRHGAEMPSGSTLAKANTSNSVDLAELLNTFPPQTRDDAQATIHGVGAGFVGRGDDLNAMLGRTPSMVRDLDATSQAILARPGAAARFAPSGEQLARAYDPVRGELSSGFAPEGRVLRAFGDPASRLRQTLSQAPSALASLRSGLTASTPLLNRTATLAQATRRLTAVAPAALRQATLLLDDAQPALRGTRRVLGDVQHAVPPTLSFLRGVDPVVAPAVQTLDRQLRPLSSFGAYGCDFRFMTATWRSALAFGVPTGGDPLTNLDQNQGLGPNVNSFRVLSIPPMDPQAFLADSPQVVPGTYSTDSDPAPCVAKDDRHK